MDSATHLANDAHYLDQHLRGWSARTSRLARGDLGVGVGLDLSPYYRAQPVLDLGRIHRQPVFRELLEMIAGRGTALRSRVGAERERTKGQPNRIARRAASDQPVSAVEVPAACDRDCVQTPLRAVRASGAGRNSPMSATRARVLRPHRCHWAHHSRAGPSSRRRWSAAIGSAREFVECERRIWRYRYCRFGSASNASSTGISGDPRSRCLASAPRWLPLRTCAGAFRN